MVLEQLRLEQPQTKEMVRILDALGIDSSALIVTGEPESNVVKSVRNLAGIKIVPASVLNVVDISSYKALLMTVGAVSKAEQLWGESNASLRGVASSVNN